MGGTRDDFEAAVGVLLPVDPFLKGKKEKSTSRSKATANVSASAGTTPNDSAGIGKTGVHLCFHRVSEYNKLTNEQKSELYQWRKSQDGAKYSTDEKKKRKSGPKPQISDKIKAAVKSAIAQEKKKQKQTDDKLDEVATILAKAMTSQPDGNTAGRTADVSATKAHCAATAKLLKIVSRNMKKESTAETDKSK